MKFRVGEIAELVYIRADRGLSAWRPNEEVRVVDCRRGVRPDGYQYDYTVQLGSLPVGFVLESQLRKKRPPMGSWDEIEKTLRWNPLKLGESA